jgi:hypothetical protein
MDADKGKRSLRAKKFASAGKPVLGLFYTSNFGWVK